MFENKGVMVVAISKRGEPERIAWFGKTLEANEYAKDKAKQLGSIAYQLILCVDLDAGGVIVHPIKD